MYGAIYETIHGHMVPYRVPYHHMYIVLSIGQGYSSILPPFCWQYQDQRWYLYAIYVIIYSLCLHKNELDYSFYMIIYCCICILEYIFTLFYVFLLVQMYCAPNKLTIYSEHIMCPHTTFHIKTSTWPSINCIVLQFQCHINTSDVSPFCSYAIDCLLLIRRVYHSLPSPLN